MSNLHRIRPAGNLQDRRTEARRTEVGTEPLRVDRRRGEDHLQVASSRQQVSQIADQKIDVERPFVRFVENECVVAVEEPVRLDFREQNPVCHQLHERVRTGGVGEADLETDLLPQGDAHLLRDTGGDRAGGDAARLGVSDHAVDTPTCLEANQRQLRRFPEPVSPQTIST